MLLRIKILSFALEPLRCSSNLEIIRKEINPLVVPATEPKRKLLLQLTICTTYLPI